jgi:hypothetical protein
MHLSDYGNRIQAQNIVESSPLIPIIPQEMQAAWENVYIERHYPPLLDHPASRSSFTQHQVTVSNTYTPS